MTESGSKRSKQHGGRGHHGRRSHAGPRSGHGGPEVPQPSFAERVRTLLDRQRTGYLSTLSRRQPGFPFGSVMPYALDDTGCPLFLISKMAMHTQNLDQDGRCSLLVPDDRASADPLGAARATLVGSATAVAAEDLDAVRERYLERHQNARYYADYADFGFYRLVAIEVYYIGGFGVMGWVEADDYSEASPDPLADVAAGIIEHMNRDHADALVLLAAANGVADADEATMTAVDRLGFHVRLRVGGRFQGLRIPFLREARSSAETRAVMVKMVRQAR
ncbi:MAG: DUF2470 domain-containing protein [Acidobacteriota bacterium]